MKPFFMLKKMDIKWKWFGISIVVSEAHGYFTLMTLITGTPYELEILSDQKKKEIQQKIVSYCQKRKIPIEIIPVGLKPPSS